MPPKARAQKRLYYKIGEACKTLGIQPYVLRYWETEFPALAPSKSRSGQRVYSEKELEIIRRIKELLYDEGYTIAGAKKKLEGELASGNFGAADDEEAEEPESPGSANSGTEPEEAAPRAKATPRAQPRKPAARAETPEPPPRATAPPAPGPLFADLAGPAPENATVGTALDTERAERLQTLRSGIETALREAREILALLDSKPAS
jgi:DNA-binding transcriptional MerR regulator